jgi:hypothetical protein
MNELKMYKYLLENTSPDKNRLEQEFIQAQEVETYLISL